MTTRWVAFVAKARSFEEHGTSSTFEMVLWLRWRGLTKFREKFGAGVTAFLSSQNCDCTPPTYPAFAWAGSEWRRGRGVEGKGRIGGWNILSCRAPCHRDGVRRKILRIGICHFSCHSSGLSNDLCILRDSQNVWLNYSTYSAREPVDSNHPKDILDISTLIAPSGLGQMKEPIEW